MSVAVSQPQICSGSGCGYLSQMKRVGWSDSGCPQRWQVPGAVCTGGGVLRSTGAPGLPMVGFGRGAVDAAESGCFSFGSFRDSENMAEADLGLPNVGFRMWGHRNPNRLECAPRPEFSQRQRVSRPVSLVGP